MKVLRTIAEARAAVRAERAKGRRIVLVPTMGALHAGHRALLAAGRKAGDVLVLSIFVNPIQFGPSEDLSAYPRPIERDLEMAEQEGADLVFLPEAREMYASDFETFVDQKRLPNHLCGLARPGHFRGVLTVVLKLFHVLEPDVAVFGEKDRQQLLVIRRMVRDLDLPVEILAHPTVREPSGLARSSRNAYLSKAGRRAAPRLWKALQAGKRLLDRGVRDPAKVRSAMAGAFKGEPLAQPDYIAVVDPGTLEDLREVGAGALLALAVRVEKARLIDNLLWEAPARPAAARQAPASRGRRKPLS